MIQWEVQSFATTDPLHDNGELLTLIRDVSRDSTFETLFVVHPERATVTSPDLDGRCRRIARRPGVIMEVHEKATRAEAEETVVQMLHEAFRVRARRSRIERLRCEHQVERTGRMVAAVSVGS
jgi:hypothetical protein